jgi:hypothetical protein
MYHTQFPLELLLGTCLSLRNTLSDLTASRAMQSWLPRALPVRSCNRNISTSPRAATGTVCRELSTDAVILTTAKRPLPAMFSLDSMIRQRRCHYSCCLTHKHIAENPAHYSRIEYGGPGTETTTGDATCYGDVHWENPGSVLVLGRWY